MIDLVIKILTEKVEPEDRLRATAARAVVKLVMVNVIYVLRILVQIQTLLQTLQRFKTHVHIEAPDILLYGTGPS